MSIILEKPGGVDPRTRYEIVTARRDRRCDDYPTSQWLSIRAGDRYLRITEFPGGESGWADNAGKPVRLHICEADWPQWVLDHLRALTHTDGGTDD